jgi:hypothetical protein
MSYVGRIWRGEMPLAITFFAFHLGGWASLFALGHLLSRTMAAEEYIWVSSTLIPLWLGFFIWSLTGIWRAAEHASKWPKIFARGWVMVVSLNLIQTIVFPIFIG